MSGQPYMQDPAPGQGTQWGQQPSGDHGSAGKKSGVKPLWVAAIAFGALFVGCVSGVGIGSSGGAADARIDRLESELAAAELERDEVQEQLDTAEEAGQGVEELQEQLEERDADIDELEAEITDLEGRLAAAEQPPPATGASEEAQAAPAAEPPSEAAPAADTAAESPTGQGGIRSATYTAGDFTFADVQVRADGIDDFEVVTRMTNNGAAVESASFTVTIFNEGSVVGTGSAFVSDMEAGATNTMTFISTDDYTEPFDDVEFQVDFTY